MATSDDAGTGARLTRVESSERLLAKLDELEAGIALLQPAAEWRRLPGVLATLWAGGGPRALTGYFEARRKLKALKTQRDRLLGPVSV